MLYGPSERCSCSHSKYNKKFILLTMSTVNGIWEGVFYILVFGIGTIIAMLAFTTIIGIPFILSSRKVIFNKLLTQATGVISAGFGVYYMIT
jgi:sulfite exporter TauE/SafE